MFYISVERRKTEGELRFTCGNVVVSTTCWWDLKKKIPAYQYTGCAYTNMVTKGREAIFIPGVPGYEGIFIHEGHDATWSDGCIIIEPLQLKTILNTIPSNLKEQPVITVDVRDV